jgi:hypothetical protein
MSRSAASTEGCRLGYLRVVVQLGPPQRCPPPGWCARWSMRTTPPPSGWIVPRPAPWWPLRTPTPAGAALRSAAVIRLLLHNALRVDEACTVERHRPRCRRGASGAAGDAQGSPAGQGAAHPGDGVTLDAYLADRATRAGVVDVGRLAPRAPVGAGAPAGSGCRYRELATTVPALVAALDDQFALDTRTPAPPAATTIPATVWTATSPTPSPPTSPDHGRRRRTVVGS